MKKLLILLICLVCVVSLAWGEEECFESEAWGLEKPSKTIYGTVTFGDSQLVEYLNDMRRLIDYLVEEKKDEQRQVEEHGEFEVNLAETQLFIMECIKRNKRDIEKIKEVLMKRISKDMEKQSKKERGK